MKNYLRYGKHKVRTCCVFLYDKTHLYMINDYKNQMSIPGGVVETYDHNIHDTLLREFREEVIFQDFRKGLNYAIAQLHTRIPKTLYGKLKNNIPYLYRNDDLHTAFFFVPVNNFEAGWLTKMGMHKVPIDYLDSIKKDDKPHIDGKRLRNREKIILPHAISIMVSS